MHTDHAAYLEKKRTHVIDNGILNSSDYAFYKDLFEYHKKFTALYSDTLKKNISPGFDYGKSLPLLTLETISPVQEYAKIEKDAFNYLKDVLKKHHEGIDFSELKDTPEGEPFSPYKTAALILKGDSAQISGLSSEFKTADEEFIFFNVNLIRPFVTALRLHDFPGEIPGADDWLENRCPFCGYFPDIALISRPDDNKKFLHCALCENIWTYKRLTCPACGNEDSSLMGFFTHSGNPRYRFDYCEKCGAYFKCIVIEKGGDISEIDLFSENILSNFLDAAALDMGYRCL